jgi:hypothetical protein
MTTRIISIPALLAISVFSFAGCARMVGQAGSAAPQDRASQSSAILGEVLRFEIRNLPTGGQQTQVPICVAVQKGGVAVDPDETVKQHLPRDTRVRPQSTCPTDTALVLVAGPIDWVTDTEVRVRTSRRLPQRAAAPSVYRVVWHSGQWACVGPIVINDPL